MPKCITCTNLDLEEIIPEFRRTNFDFEKLVASVGNGCHGCQVIYDGLLARRGTVRDIRSVALNSFGTNRPLNVTAFKESGGYEVLQFYTLSEEPSPWPIIGAARHISVDSSSEECFELASTWIHDCWRYHNCGQKYGPLPTRVLQLDRNENNVFLFEPEGRKKERYAALSHCWGGAMPIKTTKENIAQHKTGIALSSLPKTFRDAVAICRKLRINYLWIDSLCIIQDSSDDWEEEAGQMARIYAAADFTIAAHSATDSTGGCFVPRAETGPQASTRVEYKTQNGETGVLYVRGEPPGSPNGDHLSTNLPQFREPGPSKLSTRGWVFQERILSRRTLHYTPHELVFECSQGFQCECTIEQSNPPEGLVKFKQQYLLKKKPVASDSRFFGSENPDVWLAHSLQRIMDIKERKPTTDFDWPNIVEGFSRLDLTYASDRLPALYGLAESKLRATSTASYSDQYHFGLWKSDILAGLLWQVGRSNHFSFDGCESKRQPDSFAPSWSWASVTGPVHYEDNFRVADPTDPKKLQPYDHRFKILDVKTTPSTSNLLGPGTGLATFMCGVVPVRIFLASPRGEITSKSFIAASKKAIPGKTECPYGFFNPDVRDDGSLEVGQESDGDNNEYFFMIVAHLGYQTITGGGKPLGLILRKSGSNSYKRVGLMRDCMYILNDWEDVSDMSIITVE